MALLLALLLGCLGVNTSLEGFGSGGVGQLECRSGGVAMYPRVTVDDSVVLSDRARSGHGVCCRARRLDPGRESGTVTFARTGRRAYHLAVPPYSASSTELERQRARIDVLFRDGWILPGPDRLPETARQSLPFIKGVGDDAEVIITGRGARQCVAALFSHQSFPGVRFGHRFTPGDKHAPIWLKEEIETGALHRMMQAQPAPDDAGIVWTTWGPTGASDP